MLSTSLRFTLVIFLAVTVPILIATLVANLYASKELKAEAEEKLALQANSLPGNVVHWDEYLIKALQNLSIQPEIISMDPQQQKPILEKMAKVYPHIYLVSTIDLKGINIARNFL